LQDLRAILKLFQFYWLSNEFLSAICAAITMNTL